MSIATQPLATESVAVGGHEITFETGKLAKQADGAVIVRSGDTMVLATAQGRMEAREGADFFPLTVDVEERMYAAGKIPGGFFKREGRPTERAALMVSPLPFMGPVGAVRIGLVDGELTVNPSLREAEEESALDLVVVGTTEALTMVEAGGEEIPEDTILDAFELAHREIVKLCEAQEQLRSRAGKAKWLDLELTKELEQSQRPKIQERIQAEGLREAGALLEDLMEELGPPLSMDSTEEDIIRQVQVRSSLSLVLDKERHAAVEGPVREQFENELRELTDAEQDSKELRSAKRQLLFDRILESLELPFPVGPATVDGEPPAVKDTLTRQWVKRAAESIYKELVRRRIAVEKRRPDGRDPEDVRPVTCEVSVSPRTHGSALFTRGQTQIMTLLTLGTAKEGQRIDDLSLEEERRYMHHYNFPPYSVGETGFMRGPKRRDIGHGALAQRALEPMIPGLDEFPYTIRLVSETLESNGSSSMGSVCGSTLALMDAGVPIKAPVSGIAMGLVKEGDDYVILTDIQGAEDHLGDMDFKVAGTREGITALQMDI